MKYIFLSPHLDDAALSCGGLINMFVRERNEVEVFTIFTGVPDQIENITQVQKIFKVYSLAQAKQLFRMRKYEDIKAMTELKVNDFYHFDFLDMPFRNEVNLKPLVQNIVLEIAPKIQKGDIVISPYAIGSHVDHMIVRKVAESIAMPIYYADVPYVMNFREEWKQLQKIQRPEYYQLSKDDFRSWKRSVSNYISQLDSLFSKRVTLEKYWEMAKGRYLWK